MCVTIVSAAMAGGLTVAKCLSVGFSDSWVNINGGWSRLPMGLDVGLFFFFFLFWWLWIVGSMIRGRHGWWSLAWEALLASLLAWR